MINVEDYKSIVGQSVIDELKLISENLESREFIHVNSTKEGGGVAEILNRMIPLLQNLGINARWEVMEGDSKFFGVTKKIHNTLHGVEIPFTDQDREIYLKIQNQNRHLIDNLTKDCVVLIHDSQPAGLIDFRSGNQDHWIWRCHIDVSAPHQPVWDFLSKFVNLYDDTIFHRKEYTQKLNPPQVIIPPSIDPLSEKNRSMNQAEIEQKLKECPGEIPNGKTIITQISRFDRLKDPVGVVQAFKIAREKLDNIHLILGGGSAIDDPEGEIVYREVIKEVKDDPDISVWQLPHDELLINALQRRSDIIIQKSLKEGFGLTVSEALWKSKPVIATNVGGIKSQIIHNETGVLVNSISGAAIQIQRLIKQPKLMIKMGNLGKEFVKNNFLITRHIKDYLLLLAYAQGDRTAGGRIVLN